MFATEKRHSGSSSSMSHYVKLSVLLVVLLLSLFFLMYKLKYRYEHFDIKDVRQPASFTYKKDTTHQVYTAIVVRVKGEIKGRATVIVDYCNHKSTNYQYYPSVKLIITGKVDTVMTNQYYTGQACIEYRPRKVEDGELSVAVSVR
jgi:hypothetical protein